MPVSTLPRPPCDDGYKCWLWCDVRCQDPAFPSWDTAGQRKTGDGCIDNIAVSTAPLEVLNFDIDTFRKPRLWLYGFTLYFGVQFSLMVAVVAFSF